MRRVADFLFRNWPLKLAAILLATVLYSGLVLGQNVRTWTGTLPVDTIRPPAGAVVIAEPDPVTQVRYRAPIDVGIVSSSFFNATVDLSTVDVQPGGQPQTAPVTVVALNPNITVVDFQPRQVQVILDPVTTREIPVEVTYAPVPEGLSLGPEQLDPTTVTVRGASSRVDAVARVLARVAIDSSALNVDREIDLIAVDTDGNQVPNVEIDPERAHVRIAVARQLATRTLPVVPNIVGQPASGYRIASVTVEPLVVTISGEEATVSQLQTADTEPIDISGRNRDVEASVRIALPAGVSVAGGDTVRVIVTIGEVSGSEAFPVAIDIEGAEAGLIYRVVGPSLPDGLRADATLTGPLLLLDQLDDGSLVAVADVSGLEPGSHDVDLSLSPPEGLTLVDMAPTTLTILVEPPASSPATTP